jgi:hypothetical protein
MLQIYQASVSNLRELRKQKKNLKRLFNKSVRGNDHSSFNALTKLYALLYSSFAEVCFLKMIHTPYGFSDNFIQQIQEQRNLEQKWQKCLTLAFAQIENMANRGDIQNKKLLIQRYINLYIIEPSQLRNKIAHGQWSVALNNDNTAINSITTSKVLALDFVQIDILFEVYEKIGQTIEDLIESPHKTHFRDFYLHMTELEKLILETANWNISSKINILKATVNRQEEIKSKRGV